MQFSYTGQTSFKTLRAETHQTAYYNLKNKAEGARQYGYRGQIEQASNPDGTVAFRAIYRTTLNGAGYQSAKASKWVATEDEARNLLAKTIVGALKRYDRLAQDPASKIEHRI
jgi:hypothetical protein